MKNLWPESFKENPKPSVKSILEEQAKLLSKLTTDIVFAEVEDVSPQGVARGIRGEFNYRFNIFGKFLTGYRFKVMDFAHDITLYPVRFYLDSELAKELKFKPNDLNIKKIENPEDLELFIQSVLKSNRIQNVVGSILKLSK